MKFSKVIGTGGYLAEDISDFDLEKRVDTTHAWIVERTGIVSGMWPTPKNQPPIWEPKPLMKRLSWLGLNPTV